MEMWDLIDIDKNKTGETHARINESTIPAGRYHIVVEIWTINEKKEMLLTRRHPNKHYPLMWECTGGSVVAGEESVEGAYRELFEETGIKAKEGSLIYLGDVIKPRAIMENYLCLVNSNEVTLRLQEEEVVDAKWISLDELYTVKDELAGSCYDRFLYFRDKIIAHLEIN